MFLPFSTTNPNTFGFTNVTNNAAPTINTYPNAGYNGNYFGDEQSNPHKTNTTWFNLVGYNTSNRGTETVGTYPYTYKAKEWFVEMGCNTERTVSGLSTLQPHQSDIEIGANEIFDRKQLTSQNVFGAEYRYFNVSTPNNTMTSWFISGQAFLTIRYENLTPVFNTPHAILNINGDGVLNNGKVFSGDSFEIEYNSGRVWKIYSPSSVSLTLNTSDWKLTMNNLYNGIVKVCYLGQATNLANISANRSIFDTYGNNNSYVIGGDIDDTTFSGNTANFIINWNKVGNSPLLHFALPHHIPILQSPNIKNLQGFQTIKGDLVGIEGDTWTMTETLQDLPFVGDITTQDVTDIQNCLNTDAQEVIPGSADTDTYFGFKELGEFAMMAAIANSIGDTVNQTQLINKLRTVVDSWLNFSNPNTFRYDNGNGGVVSTDAAADGFALFGSGAYNDHHFHYGYFLHACGVLAEFDPGWATQSVIDKVNCLVRDIFNPSTNDTFFPQYRSKDWYVGHSWAGGTSIFGDVNNQESISEDINAWYGLSLWADATNQTEMYNLARLAHAQSIRAGKAYWQGSVQDDEINAGIEWVTKQDNATFFGANPEYVQGIQMIPWTPGLKNFYEDPYATTLWNRVFNDILQRTSLPEGANSFNGHIVINNGGSGYSGADGSYTANGDNFAVANNISTTNLTGSGSGLTVNANINLTQGGRIWEVFAVGTSLGSGYQDGDQLQINAPGGSGSIITLQVSPTTGWQGLLYGLRASTDPDEAYSFFQTHTGFDNGSNKVNMLSFVSSFRNSTTPPSTNLGPQRFRVYTNTNGKLNSVLI